MEEGRRRKKQEEEEKEEVIGGGTSVKNIRNVNWRTIEKWKREKRRAGLYLPHPDTDTPTRYSTYTTTSNSTSVK